MASAMIAPLTIEEQTRAHDLAVMKRRATTLLVVVAAVFSATLFGDDAGWLGFVRAAAEGALVGGLADWFAVTALFRHPLGLPIPHTAVVKERKDHFGHTLGTFVQENFLSPEVIGERIQSSAVVERTGQWLSQPANAAKVAGYLSDLLAGAADVVRDDDVHRLLQEQLDRLLEHVALAPLAGRVLEMATADDRHQALLSDVLHGLANALEENADRIQERFTDQSPWWLPDSVEHRIFDRVLARVRSVLDDMADDPDHEMRKVLDERIASLIDHLQHDESALERGEQLKHELLANDELRRWTTALWSDVKKSLKEQAATPESPLRQWLTTTTIATGERLNTDVALRLKVEGFLESGVRYVTVHYRDEIAGLVSGTISRWDGDVTSNKLELLLGRDLQFIRINGTVVGGLAAVAIHTVVVLTA